MKKKKGFIEEHFFFKKPYHLRSSLFFVHCRFLCSEEDEGFSTEPVSNKQNGGPLVFSYNQKVIGYC